MKLTPLVQTFVLHFGEMGSRWGINRTVGQIYALLYLSPTPLHAGDIADTLGFSRSNVSMGLKELASWRLIRLKHLPEDRRDYFTTPDDVWDIFKTLAEERRKREVEPTLSVLRDALLEDATNDADRHAQQRMRAMHDLIELVTRWMDDLQNMDPRSLERLMRFGSRLLKLIDTRPRGGKDDGLIPDPDTLLLELEEEDHHG